MASRRAIREAADKFRAKHWPTGKIPVDIELVAEKQGIDIVPEANLRDDVGIDACTSANLRFLYIDLQYYMNPVMEFRVRFSVAHELGHVALHKRIFEEHAKKEPQTVSEWAKYVQGEIETPILESQANEFAGCLLVPEGELRTLYEGCYPTMREEFEKKGKDLDAADPNNIRPYLAAAIHREFEVSTQVIEIRLREYGIVPNH